MKRFHIFLVNRSASHHQEEKTSETLLFRHFFKININSRDNGAWISVNVKKWGPESLLNVSNSRNYLIDFFANASKKTGVTEDFKI